MDQRRRRGLLGTVLALVLLLVLTACGGDGKPSKSFAARPTVGLATLLERAPKVSGPGASKWARDYTPSTSQYLDEFYAKATHPMVRAQLEQQGLREIAHTLWITDDQIQNDIVLLRFATADGAIARSTSTRTTNSSNRSLQSYSIDGAGQPVVYYSDRANNEGFRQANTYAQVGPFVVEMFTFAPDSVPRTQIQTWVEAQVALLE